MRPLPERARPVPRHPKGDATGYMPHALGGEAKQCSLAAAAQTARWTQGGRGGRAGGRGGSSAARGCGRRGGGVPSTMAVDTLGRGLFPAAGDLPLDGWGPILGGLLAVHAMAFAWYVFLLSRDAKRVKLDTKVH